MKITKKQIKMLVLLLLLIVIVLIVIPKVQAKTIIANVADMLPSATNNIKSASFEEARQAAGIKEGGYTNDKNDNGNWTGGAVGQGNLVGTNYGIAAPTYQTYYKKTPTVADMKNLTYQQATEIMKGLYWDKFKLDELPYSVQPLADLVFDTSIQHGKAAYLIQRAINRTGYSPKLSEDNAWGSLSRAALLAVGVTNTPQLYQNILNVRWEYYQKQSSFASHGEGWANRIACFTDYYATPPGGGKCYTTAKIFI